MIKTICATFIGVIIANLLWECFLSVRIKNAAEKLFSFIFRDYEEHLKENKKK